jgi:hypothetical protein
MESLDNAHSRYSLLLAAASPRLFKAFVGITDEQLRQWYHEEGKSQAAIAEELGVSVTAVANQFKHRGIPTRPPGGTHFKGQKRSAETIARMKDMHGAMWQDPEFRASQIARMQEGKRRLGLPPR